jgi:hypothetical protein
VVIGGGALGAATASLSGRFSASRRGAAQSPETCVV